MLTREHGETVSQLLHGRRGGASVWDPDKTGQGGLAPT